MPASHFQKCHLSHPKIKKCLLCLIVSQTNGLQKLKAENEKLQNELLAVKDDNENLNKDLDVALSAKYYYKSKCGKN